MSTDPAGGATTGLLVMLSGGATTYYHQDDLSVLLTTNSSGATASQDGHFPQVFFTSHNRTSESGQDYALTRYYDSRTGPFCSVNPLAGSPESPQSWNRYPYGRKDPIEITDPSRKL